MIKNITFALATTLIAFSSYVHADTDSEIMALKQRVKTLEQKKEGSNRVTPPARPDVKDGADLFITADVLLWRAEEDGLEFAEETFQDTSKIQNLTDGRVLNPNFDWKWGFRVGIGYNMPHDGWDLYLDWVRFTSRDHKSNSVNPPTGAAATTLFASTGSNSAGGPSSNVQQASVHWNLKLNMLDLELGREFFVSKWLTLRPFTGLRSGWIDQKLSTDYINEVPSGATLETFDIDQRCRFWGLGIRAGLNTLWSLGCGWGIYGNAAISLLPGRFHINYEQDSTQVTVGTDSQHYTKDHLNAARAVTDLALGLRWDTLTCDEAYHFAFRVGFEQHHFFGQNQFRNYNYDSSARPVSRATLSDLTTYGVTAGFEFGF